MSLLYGARAPLSGCSVASAGKARPSLRQVHMALPTTSRNVAAGVASIGTVVAVAELMDFSATNQSAVLTAVVPKPSKPAASAARSASALPNAAATSSVTASSLTPVSIERNKKPRHPLAVRVSKSPGYASPAGLIQALQGSSHECLIVGRSDNLELSGNYSINGPAIITKRDGRLIAEILPGGELGSWLQDEELCNMEEVLGDDMGRLTAGLNAEHVEVCGNMELDSSIRFINHHNKRVLSVSHMHDGQSVTLYAGGNLSHPVNVQPQCDHCTCQAGPRGSFV